MLHTSLTLVIKQTIQRSILDNFVLQLSNRIFMIVCMKASLPMEADLRNSLSNSGQKAVLAVYKEKGLDERKNHIIFFNQKHLFRE